MRKSLYIGGAALAVAFAFIPNISKSSDAQAISDPVSAESCVYHSESIDPIQCKSFHIYANFETREFEIGAEMQGARVAFRVDAFGESQLAFAFPTLFFEGLERSLRVRGFAELKDGIPDWEITDGHCTGDGAGNLTCAALGGDETVVLKLKGTKL